MMGGACPPTAARLSSRPTEPQPHPRGRPALSCPHAYRRPRTTCITLPVVAPSRRRPAHAPLLRPRPALQFCAGIALLREKAGASAPNRKLVDDFMAAAAAKGGLWDIMSNNAGWGPCKNPMQLPNLTTALWQTFLDSTSADEALQAYVATFFPEMAAFHGEMSCTRLVGIAERMLAATARNGGFGDFFDLIDADFSGSLSVEEMFRTCAAMKKAFPKKSALVSYWEKEVKDLYASMARSAGWPADTKLTQLPHLTRPEFEKFWGEKQLELDMFAGLVQMCCQQKAMVQSHAASDEVKATAAAQIAA